MMLLASIGGWLIGGVVVAVLVAVIVLGVKQHMARTAALNAAIDGLADFISSQRFIGCDAETAFAVDERTNRICLATAGTPATTRLIDYRDLLEVELVEDGIVIAKSARASRLRGVVMGGTDPLRTDLLRPGEVPVNRGLNPVPPGKVREIVLRFTVNDAQRPMHAVKCMNSETQRTDSNYLRIMNDARAKHVWFTSLLEKAELDEAAETSVAARTAAAAASANLSVADELQKLAQLHRDGVLNDAEFAAEKSRILTRR